MPGGCDAAYLTNLHSEFGAHPEFVKGEDRRNWDKEFGIRHYAGTVTYRDHIDMTFSCRSNYTIFVIGVQRPVF